MNKTRRSRINKAIACAKELVAAIEELRDEESDCYDNLPESLQDSERADAMQEAMDALENARDSLTDAIEYLIEAKDV